MGRILMWTGMEKTLSNINVKLCTKIGLLRCDNMQFELYNITQNT